MYDLSKNLPLLASLVAKGVTTCAVGDAVTSTVTLASAGLMVAKAFAPDVTEHFVSVLDYARFKEFLLKTQPEDLNHDLDKLIKGAMIRALGFIKHLYIDRLKEEQTLTFWEKFKSPFGEIEGVLSAMERDLNASLNSTTFQKADLENYLTGEHTDCFERLVNYLFSVSGVNEENTEWQQLRQFFRDQLPALFDLAYKEALKDEKNTKAFKAFEIWILEEGLRNQKELLVGQRLILEELTKLKENQSSVTHTNVLRQLENDTQRIRTLFAEKLDEVISQLTRIEAIVNRTEGTTNRTEGKVDQVLTILESGALVQRPIPHLLTNIPAFGGDFVGRQDELILLRNTLNNSQKVVLMNGTGGIGKTTLAKRFVQQHRNEYDHVCWIEVTKQDAAVKGKLQAGTIQEAMVDHPLLFKNLGVAYNPKEESPEQRFEQLMNTLSNLTGRNLFVIDNAGADAGEKNIRNRLPQPPHWQVLITSRQKLNGYTLLPLDRLDEEAAEQLFYTYYTYDCAKAEVVDLLIAIQYHTLTIELFAKTLEAHHGTLSVGDLLKKVRERTLNDPDLQRKIETEHQPDETEVFLHLMLAFDCSELTADEKRVLRQLALLPPEPYTVREQLAPWLGYEDAADQRILAETLAQLEKKGWLTCATHAYSLHRLLQQVIVYQLPFVWEEAKPLVEAITVILRTVDNPNALAVYPLRRYGEFLLATLPSEEQEKPEVSRLKNNLALVCRDLGRYKDAAGLLELALTSDQRNFGPDHPSTAVSQSNLAVVYQDLGRYEDAAGLLELALTSAQRNFGPDHPSTAVSQSNLALVFLEIGRVDKAIVLLQNAEQTFLSFGPDHPNTKTIQSNLSYARQKRDREL